MKAKSTLLVALFFSGTLIAGTSQAHSDDILWPLLPLTGLVLLHNHHHDHGDHYRYRHDDHRSHKRYSHSYGRYEKGRSHSRDHRGGEHRRYRD